MLALNDDQLEQVRQAARALPPQFRDSYLQTLAALLKGQPLTPATVQRACAQAQAHTLQLYALQPDDDEIGY
jgi:hypothetical protein